jgi:hypothetical protein
MKRTLSLLLFLVLTAVAASAQGQSKATKYTSKYTAPRTEGGRPDLQGVWNFNTSVPMQRPASLGDKKVFTKEEFEARRGSLQTVLGLITALAPVEAIGLDWMDGTMRVEDLRTSLITYPANGRVPAKLEGVKQMPQLDDFLAGLAESSQKGPVTLPPQLGALIAAFQGGKKDSYTDFMPSERCLFDAFVPMVPQLDDNYVQIVQGSDHVVLISDFWRRVIALDGKPFPGNAQRTWVGVSRGRWDGDTLVVETRNFNDRLPSFAGAGTGLDKVVTERFTRTAANTIEYSATVVDPKTFRDRIELSFPMALVDARIHESGCHEGNYSMRNSLGASRLADAAAAKQAK